MAIALERSEEMKKAACFPRFPSFLPNALRDALFNMAYTSSSEFIGEMGRVIAAIARASGAVPAPVNQALARSLEEVHKIWPAFG
jgi:hypothetical protein